MRLTITESYMNELKDKYATQADTARFVYGIKQKWFSFLPKQYILLLEKEMIHVITLNSLTAEVKQVSTINIAEDAVQFKFKEGIILSKFKVYCSGKKCLDIKISKNLMGMKELQRKGIDFMIENYISTNSK